MRGSEGMATGQQTWAAAITFGLVVGLILVGACINWNLYVATKVGQAAVPGPAVVSGPVVIVSRNIHGIYANLMACIRTKADVICIQEADIADSDVMDFREHAVAAGYECK